MQKKKLTCNENCEVAHVVPVASTPPEHVTDHAQTVGSVRVAVAVGRVQDGHLDFLLRLVLLQVEAHVRVGAERGEADASVVVSDVHLVDDGQDELLHLVEVDPSDAA